MLCCVLHNSLIPPHMVWKMTLPLLEETSSLELSRLSCLLSIFICMNPRGSACFLLRLLSSHVASVSRPNVGTYVPKKRWVWLSTSWLETLSQRPGLLVLHMLPPYTLTSVRGAIPLLTLWDHPLSYLLSHIFAGNTSSG